MFESLRENHKPIPCRNLNDPNDINNMGAERMRLLSHHQVQTLRLKISQITGVPFEQIDLSGLFMDRLREIEVADGNRLQQLAERISETIKPTESPVTADAA